MWNAWKTLFVSLFLLLAAACSSEGGPSAQEQVVLQSNAFSNSLFNAHDHVGDVVSIRDAIPASRPFHVSTLTEAIAIPVRDCTVPGLYEMEKQMALSQAAQDASGRTVPVKFSYSFGKKHDALAKAANERAVLSENNPGYTYIPVGGKTSSKHGRKHAYYIADNQAVAEQYRTGQRCFFSTIQIDPDSFVESSSKYDFISITQSDVDNSYDLLKSKKTFAAKKSYLHHMIHYMYFGYCRVGRCASGQAFAGEFANRLFDEIPSMENGQPQIIKLYMADFRSEQVEHDVFRIAEDTTRGLEIETGIDNILNVCKIHEHYYDVTKNISLPKEVNGFEFDPIKGAVQLINNIISHDVDGNLMSTQYTPIVIDLDGDGVGTSSVRWGTYFNMAALANDSDNKGQAHRTAWLGGDYTDYNQSAQDSRVNLDVRLKNRDGFLVLVNDQDKVTSSTQMFGDNITVGGQTYENGFLALQAFAGKNCSSSAAQDRYVGPWDGDIYDTKLKIWVDEDRNGVTNDGEILSLREAKIAAINACNISHQDEQDAFGNGTHLRSAALMATSDPSLLDDTQEIIFQLQNGFSTRERGSQFSLVIDLIFKAKEDDLCPTAPLEQVDHPSLIPVGDPTGIASNEPPPILPIPPDFNQ